MRNKYLQRKQIKITLLLIWVFSTLGFISGNHITLTPVNTDTQTAGQAPGNQALNFSEGVQTTKTESKFRIDTHIHLYDTNREGSSTFLNPVKNQKIYYPHLAPEFLEAASSSGVNYAVVVEASKRREDNFWAMEIVNHSENLLAFVANLDPRDPDYISDLDALSKNKKFRGIRIRPQKNIDISDSEIIEKLGELAKRNLVLELGPNQEPIEAIEEIANKYPKMNIIMNHMAGCWDGAPKRNAPGFPDDGQWVVKSEGLKA